jgi:hypothetical protein
MLEGILLSAALAWCGGYVLLKVLYWLEHRRYLRWKRNLGPQRMIQQMLHRHSLEREPPQSESSEPYSPR